jgi:hypothetical protein
MLSISQASTLKNIPAETEPLTPGTETTIVRLRTIYVDSEQTPSSRPEEAEDRPILLIRPTREAVQLLDLDSTKATTSIKLSKTETLELCDKV